LNPNPQPWAKQYNTQSLLQYLANESDACHTIFILILIRIRL
jgi:hypothetical protein